MKKHPLFVENEEVQLVVKTNFLKEMSGDYTVHDVIQHGCRYVSRLSGRTMTSISPHIGYLLTPMCVHPTTGREITWHESSLRKKFKPADMSFEDLMVNLTSPTPVAGDDLSASFN